jgi:hypothetical protein
LGGHANVTIGESDDENIFFWNLGDGTQTQAVFRLAHAISPPEDVRRRKGMKARFENGKPGRLSVENRAYTRLEFRHPGFQREPVSADTRVAGIRKSLRDSRDREPMLAENAKDVAPCEACGATYRYGEFGGIRKEILGRSRGRGSRNVRGKVREGKIDIVPQSRNQGKTGHPDGADHALIVERIEVVPAPSAANEKDGFRAVDEVRPRKSVDDGLRRFVSLDRYGDHDYLTCAEAVSRDADDIVDRCAGGGRYDGDTLRKGRKRALQLRGKHSLFEKTVPEFFPGARNRSCTYGGETSRINLVRPALRVDGNSSFDDNLVASTRPQRYPKGIRFE